MIQYIWIAFTGIFSCLACFHTYRATQKIRKMPRISGVKAINGVSTGMLEFQEGLDRYVDQLNLDNRWANIATAIGYLITAATALFSYFLI